MNSNILDSTSNDTTSRKLIANVFSYMFAALAISGAIAWLFGHNEDLMLKLYDASTGKLNGMGWAVMFSPFIISLVLQFGYRRISMPILLVLYIAYAALMGASLGFIFYVFTIGSIASVFFITAGTYAAMALLGYTTKTDLTKFGGIMYMAFIGIMIAVVVNMFIQSSGLDYIISIISVLVFTGLTAYYMQTIKNWSQNEEYNSESASKLSLIFGLQMYILFINLFLTLLRLLGNRE